MAAYVVQVRVDRIRVEGGRTHRPATARKAVANSRGSWITAVAGDAVEVIGPRSPGRLESRLARVRELWSQTTFYLFDAESWRR